jgi:hypothetical protein
MIAICAYCREPIPRSSVGIYCSAICERIDSREIQLLLEQGGSNEPF